MSSKIYKRCELMGDRMGNKRKMKRELKKKEARCMSIILLRKGAKKKLMGIIKGVNLKGLKLHKHVIYILYANITCILYDIYIYTHTQTVS